MTFNYDSIAADYAAKVDKAPFNALYERPAMMNMLPDVRGKHILDAGCGSGWYSEQLAQRGAIVDGIDSSAAMVDFARSRLERDALNAKLSVGDLSERLPFGDQMFDGIVSALVLHYMRDMRPALREMNRVLKTDGWVQFSTHHPSADAALFETRAYFSTEHVVDHWDWCGDVEFYRRSLTEIVDSIRDAGLNIDRIVEPVPTTEFRDQKPDSFAQLMNQPAFLIFRLTKD